MTIELALTIAAVAAALGVLLLLMRHYPRRILRRIVVCPEKGVLAEVAFLRAEVDFATLGSVDVAECTLLAGAPVACDKRCLH